MEYISRIGKVKDYMVQAEIHVATTRNVANQVSGHSRESVNTLVFNPLTDESNGACHGSADCGPHHCSSVPCENDLRP